MRKFIQRIKDVIAGQVINKAMTQLSDEDFTHAVESLDAYHDYQETQQEE